MTRSTRTAELTVASGGNASGTTAERALWDAARFTASREEIDQMIERAVARARAEGVPWSQIGAALGLSKQGAAQRYAPRRPLTDGSRDVALPFDSE